MSSYCPCFGLHRNSSPVVPEVRADGDRWPGQNHADSNRVGLCSSWARFRRVLGHPERLGGSRWQPAGTPFERELLTVGPDGSPEWPLIATTHKWWHQPSSPGSPGASGRRHRWRSTSRSPRSSTSQPQIRRTSVCERRCGLEPAGPGAGSPPGLETWRVFTRSANVNQTGACLRQWGDERR